MARSVQKAKANVSKPVVINSRLAKGPSTTSDALVSNGPAPKAPANAAAGKPSKSVTAISKSNPKILHGETAVINKKRPNKGDLESSNEPTVAERAKKRAKTDSQISESPSEKLDVYVFGLGDCGELGLGSAVRDGKKPKKVRRPRFNDLLDGVVQVAVGGMHCIAITQDQKILTWGVNDNGALGRDTTWEAPTRNISDGDDEEDEDEDEEEVLNPRESTPTAIPEEFFGPGTKIFTQVAATDSASFVLTDDGSVYGWGTFSGNDGPLGFFTADALEAKKTKDSSKKFQRRPVLIPGLKKIKLLAAGGNHVQALDHKGNVFSWGTGEQCQLGRRVIERTREQALTPCQFGLPRNKIASISCGAYHSFAIDLKGDVYAWGLNNFGQTGITAGAGESEAVIGKPCIVRNLDNYKIKEIRGGNHHSIACTVDGQVLVWGRCDDAQLGLSLADLPEEDLMFDSRHRPRILKKPTVVPGIYGTSVAAGIDNCLAISKNGQVYSWGFSAGYRTGLGTDDSVKEPTLLENSALKGKKISFVGCGGQFSVLAGPTTPLLNGSV